MNNILLVLLGHYIADYPLQGTFLATTKGNNWYSLLAHSIIYSLTIGLCLYYLGVYALWKIAILIISHYAIDGFKAKAKNKDKQLTTYLYIDQALHITINILLLI